MSDQQVAEEEDYAGASLDTVNVPDDDIAILEDMAKPVEAKEEELVEQKEPEAEDKRSLYTVPRNKLVKQWHEANEAKASEADEDTIAREDSGTEESSDDGSDALLPRPAPSELGRKQRALPFHAVLDRDFLTD